MELYLFFFKGAGYSLNPRWRPTWPPKVGKRTWIIDNDLYTVYYCKKVVNHYFTSDKRVK